jgi:hypothetical protein
LRSALGAVTVDLSGAERNNVGAEVANQAVQQLIWTATAASGRQIVRLLVDGEQVSELWGHVAVGGDLRRPPEAEVLAHVWLIDPQHGATVGKTFTVHISGVPYESTVHLTVKQGTKTVAKRFITVAGATYTQFGEGKLSLTLPVGKYTIYASEENAAGGPPNSVDDHAITVR